MVFRFADPIRDPAATCAGKPEAAAPPAPPLQLFAVFCDGPRPVADATGTATGSGTAAGDQLVAAVTDRLFPGSSTTGYSNAVPGVLARASAWAAAAVSAVASAAACSSEPRRGTRLARIPVEAADVGRRGPGWRIAAEAADQEIDEGAQPGGDQAAGGPQGVERDQAGLVLGQDPDQGARAQFRRA